MHIQGKTSFPEGEITGIAGKMISHLSHKTRQPGKTTEEALVRTRDSMQIIEENPLDLTSHMPETGNGGGYTHGMDLTGFPGGDLVEEGLADLARGVETIPALLVSIGAPRPRRIGLPVPEGVYPAPEHRLYEKLAETDPDSAHSRYNALVRRLVSFENAAECAGMHRGAGPC